MSKYISYLDAAVTSGSTPFLVIVLLSSFLGITLFRYFNQIWTSSSQSARSSTEKYNPDHRQGDIKSDIAKAEDRDEKASAAPSDLLSLFPPSTSQRLNLPRASVPQEQFSSFAQLQASQVPVSLPPDKYTSEMRTPTDMTLEEIRAIGDFPDYAVLTGVPHPKVATGVDSGSEAGEASDFDYSRAIPRPYRPLRWRYVQTMSLMKFEPDFWLELTSSYKATLSQRQELLKKHGSKVLYWQPGTELACKETMEMALQFYTKRWPMYFSLEERRGSKENGKGGKNEEEDIGWVFLNKILGTETVIKEHHPLQILFDNVPEDFVLPMRNKDDGLYYLRAGICCSAVGWHMGQKVNKPLAAVHGPVPDYKKNMAFSMDRFFGKMPCDRPIQRGSWEIKPGRPLFKLPPGEEEVGDDGGDGGDGGGARASDSVGTAQASTPAPPPPVQEPDLRIDNISFRVDWQTLRRLPLSGAIVFNFRCIFYPMTEFRDEKALPALMHTILTESKENMLEYKDLQHMAYVLLPNLKRWAEEQEASGLVEPGREVCTLDESPFFEGWQDKWRRKMQAGQDW